MTFDDVQLSRRIAYLPLSNGTLLRYRPEDGTVRVLAYPNRPDKMDRMPILRSDIPLEGWRHVASCGCSYCRLAASGIVQR